LSPGEATIPRQAPHLLQTPYSILPLQTGAPLKGLKVQAVSKPSELADKALGGEHPLFPPASTRLLPALPPLPQDGGRDREETRHCKNS